MWLAGVHPIKMAHQPDLPDTGKTNCICIDGSQKSSDGRADLITSSCSKETVR